MMLIKFKLHLHFIFDLFIVYTVRRFADANASQFTRKVPENSPIAEATEKRIANFCPIFKHTFNSEPEKTVFF